MLEMETNGAGGRGVERAVGERSGGAAGRAAREGAPDPELVERPKRRRFSAEYKLRVLREADACTRPGEVGALLRREGLYTSHSRPYTSTDNPYSEAQFKTLKYRPGFPQRFDSLEHARAFCREFFGWYNHQHRHSGIGLMTPARSTTAAPSRPTPSERASATPPTGARPSGSSGARRRRRRYRRRPGSTSPTARR
jgi:Integrase core domain